MVKNDVVVIGSSSEIGTEFIKTCIDNSENVITISRNTNIETQGHRHLKINDYLSDYEDIKNLIKKLHNPVLIFFNGYLAENRDLYNPTEDEIVKTDKINFVIPYSLSQKLNDELNNISKYVYISTMAAIKPRYKNYIYGLSKKKLEESVNYLNLPSLLIIRFGKVTTKMSKNHSDPPFTLSSRDAAYYLYKKLDSNGIKYPHFGLLFIANLIKLLPLRVLKKIKT